MPCIQLDVYCTHMCFTHSHPRHHRRTWAHACTTQVIEAATRSYHRVHGTSLSGEIDPSLLGITLIYLAAKCADTPRDLRDCITVGVSVADPAQPSPIPIDEK
jgi:hypothetical protein